MKHLIRLFVSVLVPAFMLAGVGAQPAVAQEKAKAEAKEKAKEAKKEAKAEKGKPTVKVLVDNDKVRVQEVTYKPGDEGASVARPYRIVRILKGGTVQRTYPDGKVEKYERKTGEVRAAGPDAPYKVKNIGKTEVVFYVVQLKEPKK